MTPAELTKSLVGEKATQEQLECLLKHMNDNFTREEKDEFLLRMIYLAMFTRQGIRLNPIPFYDLKPPAT